METFKQHISNFIRLFSDRIKNKNQKERVFYVTQILMLLNECFFFSKTKAETMISFGLGKVEHLAQHFCYTAIPLCLQLNLLDELWCESPFHFAITTSSLPYLLISLLPKFLLNPYKNNIAQLVEQFCRLPVVFSISNILRFLIILI